MGPQGWRSKALSCGGHLRTGPYTQFEMGCIPTAATWPLFHPPPLQMASKAALLTDALWSGLVVGIGKALAFCVNETAQRKKTGGCLGLQTLGSADNLKETLDFRRVWNWGLVPGLSQSQRAGRVPWHLAKCSVESVPGELTRRLAALSRAKKDTTSHSGPIGIGMWLTEEGLFERLL